MAAAKICEKAVEVYARGVPLEKPVDHSNRNEMQRLCFLHESNLGNHAIASQSARLGVFSHHGNTPHGIRLAVEHAMKEGLAKFVICTSTLAQGVNLPIRYLIVTSIRQGSASIKVRDFRNLIGRVGRSGMHTEGSVLFANPEIYDNREMHSERWRWTEVKELLLPDKSEPCASTLLSVFEPLQSDDRKRHLKMEPLDFVRTYINQPSDLDEIPRKIAATYGSHGYTERGLADQIAYKRNIISAIESYLMAYWEESNIGMGEEELAELARATLAYHLATEKETTRGHLVELFQLLGTNIKARVPRVDRRKVFGKTLYGVPDSLAIEKWVVQNAGRIVACANEEQLFSVLWPLIAQNVHNATFRSCNPGEILQELAIGWIQGLPFHELFSLLSDNNVRFGSGKLARHPQLEHVVDICENALAYDGMLAIGAVAEIIELLRPEDETASDNLRKLQKRLKYGLPSSLEVTIYELGFSDRVISIDLGKVLGAVSSRKKAVQQIKRREAKIRETLDKYPSYFIEILGRMLK